MHAGEQEFDEVVGIAASTELRHCRAPESGVKAGSSMSIRGGLFARLSAANSLCLCSRLVSVVHRR